ncbi:MAG: alpha/beta hydrolase [Rhodospirillales bacterium]|nr:MAG: alpha/beta hydrolase [Rhodospirillales bacterium]
MATFTSDGLDLAYEDVGPRDARRSVVLAHGFSSNRYENWKRMGWYDAFERKGMRCVALDFRGHGQSAKPHDPALYDRRAMAGDIVALMDHLAIERAALIGFSMGSHLSLTAALSHGGRFRDLVLGGVGGRMLEPQPSDGRMAAAMEAADPATIEDPMMRSFRHFADEQKEDRLALAACSRGARMEIDRAALGALAVPTLVIAGARDALAGAPQGLASAIPGAKAVVVPGCDHFSIIAHALFKATVFDFLDGYLD